MWPEVNLIADPIMSHSSDSSKAPETWQARNVFIFIKLFLYLIHFNSKRMTYKRTRWNRASIQPKSAMIVIPLFSVAYREVNNQRQL